MELALIAPFALGFVLALAGVDFTDRKLVEQEREKNV